MSRLGLTYEIWVCAHNLTIGMMAEAAKFVMYRLKVLAHLYDILQLYDDARGGSNNNLFGTIKSIGRALRSLTGLADEQGFPVVG